jgi:hypothetical protein
MIKKILKALSVVRKFGFLMALAIILSSFMPLLNARGFNDLKQFDSLDDGGGGTSNEQLLPIYQDVQISVANQIRIETELDDYIIVHSNGYLELYIPGDANPNVTLEEIRKVENHIYDINETISTDNAFVDNELNVHLYNGDKEFSFLIQNGKDYAKYSIFTGLSIYISKTTMDLIKSKINPITTFFSYANYITSAFLAIWLGKSLPGFDFIVAKLTTLFKLSTLLAKVVVSIFAIALLYNTKMISIASNYSTGAILQFVSLSGASIIVQATAIIATGSVMVLWVNAFPVYRRQ